MMNVIVTGGAGHIGSHVVDELVESNTVIVLDNGFNSNNYKNPNAKYIWQDTKDIDKLNLRADVVYHLGEYARVSPSLTEPGLVYDLNIRGTFAVVEYCLKHKCKLVYAASSTKFSDPNDNPYSFTKSTNVELIKNYGRWYGLDYAICYFYNAFGERENGVGKYATLIAKFLESSKQGTSLTVVKPGTQKRNFTYVKDIARGMVLVGEKGQSGEGYALNNPKAYSIIEIAKAFNRPIDYIEGHSGRADSGKIPNRLTGWETTLDIMEYISRCRQRERD